jgi:hypothetical protein
MVKAVAVWGPKGHRARGGPSTPSRWSLFVTIVSRPSTVLEIRLSWNLYWHILESLVMAIPVNTNPKHVDRLKRERYSIGAEIRAQLVQIALAFCGLQVKEDGQVVDVPRAEGERPRNSRNKLAAMRILTSFDRNALEQKRVEQAMEARGIKEDVVVSDGLPPMTAEIAEQAMVMIRVETNKKKAAEELAPPPPPDWRQPPKPEHEPEEDDPRWPITRLMREAILKTALELCGIVVTPEGKVQPSRTAPRPRIALAGMRIVAALDWLSIEQKRVKYLGVPKSLKEKRRRKFVMDPEIERKVNAFIHDERVKLRDRILAGDEEAIAAVADAVKSLAQAGFGA